LVIGSINVIKSYLQKQFANRNSIGRKEQCSRFFLWF